jgi:hypothetical protein
MHDLPRDPPSGAAKYDREYPTYTNHVNLPWVEAVVKRVAFQMDAVSEFHIRTLC